MKAWLTGTCTCAYSWISNFLMQRVVADGIQADLVTVDSRVTQGTV